MKKKLLFVSFLIFTITSLWAQPQKQDERLESLRIAYLSKAMQLTPDESKGFWPVYNSYNDKVKKLNVDLKAKKYSQLEYEEKLLDLRKEFKPKFTEVISNDKFERFLKADREWRDLIRREIERRRQGQGGKNS